LRIAARRALRADDDGDTDATTEDEPDQLPLI
jgi:hypothetical protein